MHFTLTKRLALLPHTIHFDRYRLKSGVNHSSIIYTHVLKPYLFLKLSEPDTRNGDRNYYGAYGE